MFLVASVVVVVVVVVVIVCLRCCVLLAGVLSSVFAVFVWFAFLSVCVFDTLSTESFRMAIFKLLCHRSCYPFLSLSSLLMVLSLSLASFILFVWLFVEACANLRMPSIRMRQLDL